MALKGTLDAFGVEDVLQMLAGSAKTGCLRVEGDGGRATVWLRDGAVTSAASDRVSGSPLDEVLCDLLRYEEGAFAFEPDDDAPPGDGNRRRGRSGRGGRGGRDGHELVPELLARARTLLAERRELEAVVPSFDHRIGLTARLADGDHITVSAEQWAVLVAVGAGCTVGELATALGLGELAALRAVHDLVTAGLTTVHPARPRAGRNGREDTAPSREVRPSRSANHVRLPTRKARDGRHADPEERLAEALDGGTGQDGRLTPDDEHPGEAWNPGEARNDRGDPRDHDDRRDRIDRHDGGDRIDRKGGGDRRDRIDGHDGGDRHDRDDRHDRHDRDDRYDDRDDRYDDEAPEAWPVEDGVPWRPPTPASEPERDRERYWPDPPPLRSRG